VPAPVWGARQLVEQSQVVKVDRSRDVATVELHLLLPGQARHDDPLEHTLGERFGRVVEAAAVHVGLAAMSATVENHRVQVDPATARSDELHPHGPPVGLYPVAEQAQGGRRSGFVLGVYGEIQVSVRPRLPTDQCVDSSTACDPEVAASLTQLYQNGQHLAESHACVGRLSIHQTIIVAYGRLAVSQPGWSYGT